MERGASGLPSLSAALVAGRLCHRSALACVLGLVEDGHMTGLQRRRALNHLDVAGKVGGVILIVDLQLVAFDLDRLILVELQPAHLAGRRLRQCAPANSRSASAPFVNTAPALRVEMRQSFAMMTRVLSALFANSGGVHIHSNVPLECDRSSLIRHLERARNNRCAIFFDVTGSLVVSFPPLTSTWAVWNLATQAVAHVDVKGEVMFRLSVARS
jgi:hypothetical protein